METAFYFLLVVCVFLMIASVAGVIVLQRITHRERMELLKLIKAESLSEYKVNEESRPAKENNNFIRKAMKQAYNKGQDDDE